MQPPAGSQVSRVPAQRTSPDQFAPPAPAPAPGRPPRRLRTVLVVVAGVLALLLVGGAVTAFVLYDRATAPDRSAPDVVVASYIQAFLIDKNDTKAAQFVCDAKADLAAVEDLRHEVEQREAKFKVVVRINWGPLVSTKTEDGESVATTLTIAGFADGQPRSSRREDWTFDVVKEEDEWRLCGAHPQV
ncbi:hypothetical protein [Micromonospora siamensis]|uniref:Uncharacterized protein n=1 Tax=Micromonospora siamensis TaxID=299152 RepID=A0A1C5GPG9_9ACTN|nr:hypothetical protein [Micromonospora siamensis]SCG35665.1 hypothetical protein GA0074704_0255 [Micromonospora siamensis]